MCIDGGGLVRLDEAECWRFLATHSLGRVGIRDYATITVLPVNYALDGQHVIFRTAPGTKLSAAVNGAPAAFEVDEATPLFETGTSVLLRGRLRVATARDELDRLRSLRLRHWAPGERDVYVVFEPHEVSGRRIPIRGAGGQASDGG